MPTQFLILNTSPSHSYGKKSLATQLTEKNSLVLIAHRRRSFLFFFFFFFSFLMFSRGRIFCVQLLGRVIPSDDIDDGDLPRVCARLRKRSSPLAVTRNCATFSLSLSLHPCSPPPPYNRNGAAAQIALTHRPRLRCNDAIAKEASAKTRKRKCTYVSIVARPVPGEMRAGNPFFPSARQRDAYRTDGL